MSDIAIKVENLCKMYKIYDNTNDRLKESLHPRKKVYHREHHALHDITLEIKKGETIGIVGKNGCGKSTLLKIITGVLTPTSGKLEVDGRISALLELGAGFNPEYTGIENIYLNGTIMGYSHDEMDSRLNNIIEFADIGEFIYQPVKNYSSGMFARLAFAVSINVEPEILIVDEILSVGDMHFQAKCMSKMKELFSRGVTVIFVTHDTNAVKALCQKTLYLKKGEMIKFGPSEEIVDLYAKDIRDEMNEENLKLGGVNAEEKVYSISDNDFEDMSFIENEEFAKRVSAFRQGTGDCILTEIQMFNSKGENTTNYEFNENIILRMYIKFIKSCKACIGYHIRDINNLEILGSNTLFENLGEVEGNAGERIIVEFSTTLPLIEGRYNVTTVLSTMKIHNRAAVLIDYTENCLVFNVSENWECKLWNKVYVKNTIATHRVRN
jgi:ABC-type polysaccharide/polyol phosphate transport system ATPase subunit